MRASNLAIAFPVLCLGCLSAPAWAESESAPSLPGPAQSVDELNAKLAVVQAHIDAYRSGDIDEFVETFSKDAVVRVDGFVAIGHDQIKALYALNFAPGAPTLRIYESGTHGELVQVSIGYIFADGQEICCSVSEYEVTHGKVSFLRTI